MFTANEEFVREKRVLKSTPTLPYLDLTVQNLLGFRVTLTEFFRNILTSLEKFPKSMKIKFSQIAGALCPVNYHFFYSSIFSNFTLAKNRAKLL